MISEIEENMFDISKLALNSQQRLSAHLTVHYKVIFSVANIDERENKILPKLTIKTWAGKRNGSR